MMNTERSRLQAAAGSDGTEKIITNCPNCSTGTLSKMNDLMVCVGEPPHIPGCGAKYADPHEESA